MSAELPTPTREKSLRFKLSVMMFLQFFIWGAWFELGFDYIPKLGFNGDWQLPLIFGAFNVGALVALFFSTQFADRKFAAEKFLAFSHLIGGASILGLFFIRPDPTNPDEVNAAFWPFFGLMLLHSIFYVPTISITNSIAFANLSDPTRDFGPVRVWGTIGWIAASWPFIFLLANAGLYRDHALPDPDAADDDRQQHDADDGQPGDGPAGAGAFEGQGHARTPFRSRGAVRAAEPADERSRIVAPRRPASSRSAVAKRVSRAEITKEVPAASRSMSAKRPSAQATATPSSPPAPSGRPSRRTSGPGTPRRRPSSPSRSPPTRCNTRCGSSSTPRPKT